jgi:hypothetical protein
VNDELAHLHKNLSPVMTHLPLFKQGFGSQSGSLNGFVLINVFFEVVVGLVVRA